MNSAGDSNAFIPDTNTPTQKRANIEFNPGSIISDPGARILIDEYDVNIRDQVRRAYIAKGPFRPVDHKFPKNGDSRTFQANWFGEFDWLEYSIHKDAAFCMWCYLFNPKRADNSGKNAFTTTGFKKWKKALNKFRSHIGLVGSSHNEATRRYRAFKNQKQSISHVFSAQGHEIEVDYRRRLTAVLTVIRLLLRQGFGFRGHDESSDSLNKGNFLEILEWHCENNVGVGKASRSNAPGNCQLTSPKVQKELVRACASETRSLIFADIGNSFFTLMVSESRDISLKEQMAGVLRYVNKHGEVIERLLPTFIYTVLKFFVG
ncbi:zinc finger MYM-type protein 1-like [Heracleum sosnowskyi]|uniref:Zinc finger MYM-type protein 1-like n=1 Tax=Heracleum sosnowskyi TaxID=360622 RepID=A0AAD8HKU3_9APIA|nr:zinc finger MYM-type protein 1-like [Heracleum sosnowskyi]